MIVDDLAGDWRPTLLALGLFVFFFAGLQYLPLRKFYGLSALRQPLDYVVILATTAIWTFFLRFVWRARLLERYLDWILQISDTTAAIASVTRLTLLITLSG